MSTESNTEGAGAARAGRPAAAAPTTAETGDAAPDPAVVAAALDGYVECALWSELDDDGEPLDAHHAREAIHVDSLADMYADVLAFIRGCLQERPDVFEGMAPGQIGHDFWLTRNHHGAGFWDRGLGERGEWLTAMAHPYGDASLYVGDDGNVYYNG
jgi:hypothetical protein